MDPNTPISLLKSLEEQNLVVDEALRQRVVQVSYEFLRGLTNLRIQVNPEKGAVELVWPLPDEDTWRAMGQLLDKVGYTGVMPCRRTSKLCVPLPNDKYVLEGLDYAFIVFVAKMQEYNQLLGDPWRNSGVNPLQSFWAIFRRFETTPSTRVSLLHLLPFKKHFYVFDSSVPDKKDGANLLKEFFAKPRLFMTKAREHVTELPSPHQTTFATFSLLRAWLDQSGGKTNDSGMQLQPSEDKAIVIETLDVPTGWKKSRVIEILGDSLRLNFPWIKDHLVLDLTVMEFKSLLHWLGSAHYPNDAPLLRWLEGLRDTAKPVAADNAKE